MKSMKNSLISVIIPAYNEEMYIGKCLSSLQKQSYKNAETIVIDDGSADKTREIIKKFKKVKLIEGQHKGPGFSRNLGAKKAKGEILVFVDADMTFPSDYLEKLTAPIRNGKSFGTEEKIQYASNMNNIWSKCWGSYAKENPPNRGNIFRAILKKKFLELRGFDPKYGYADDMTFYFKYKLGSDIADTFCYHRNPETLKEVYKQSRWIGASMGSKWQVFEVPFASHFIAILLVPASVIIIPFYSLYKTAKKNDYKNIFYYFVFYSARYFGSLIGLFRKLFLNTNVR